MPDISRRDAAPAGRSRSERERRVAIKVLRSELAAVLGAERFVQEIT